MARLYRRYRQVNFVQQGDSAPQVRGVEEVSINGQRQVRYFGDSDWATAQKDNRLPDADRYLFADSLFSEGLFDWPAERLFPFPSALNFSNTLFAPSDIGYAAPAEAFSDAEAPLASARPSPWRDAKQGVNRGVAKIRGVARKVPLALKAAWRELNQ